MAAGRRHGAVHRRHGRAGARHVVRGGRRGAGARRGRRGRLPVQRLRARRGTLVGRTPWPRTRDGGRRDERVDGAGRPDRRAGRDLVRLARGDVGDRRGRCGRRGADPGPARGPRARGRLAGPVRRGRAAARRPRAAGDGSRHDRRFHGVRLPSGTGLAGGERRGAVVGARRVRTRPGRRHDVRGPRHRPPRPGEGPRAVAGRNRPLARRPGRRRAVVARRPAARVLLRCLRRDADGAAAAPALHARAGRPDCRIGTERLGDLRRRRARLRAGRGRPRHRRTVVGGARGRARRRRGAGRLPQESFADHFSSIRPNRHTARATSQEITNSATIPYPA